MRLLLLDAKGMLGKKEGIEQRKLLELDKHDFSTEPVRIIFSHHVEGISERFGLAFLWASVYRTKDSKIPFSRNTALQIYEDHEADAPFIIGPYSFHPEGNEMTTAFSSIRHRLGGALWALGTCHDHLVEKGKDTLTPLLK